MNSEPDNEKLGEAEIEALKKTTRISLEEALNAQTAPPKAAPPPAAQFAFEKNVTGPISGIPVHTAPIPQTITLKRPSTSPITIGRQADISAAPTIVKAVHAKPSAAPGGETPTVIKKMVVPRPQSETSRIILEIDAQTSDVRQKTSPIPGVSPLEPTPAPKTIRLKRPSGVVPVPTPEIKLPVKAAHETQMAKKSETAKIELPIAEYKAPSALRKTIKIRRTDRNIIPRTVALSRKPTVAVKPVEAEPPVEAPAPARKEPAVPSPVFQDEPLPVFSVLAGLAAVCLALLVYLLAAQAFGPKLILPVPPALF